MDELLVVLGALVTLVLSIAGMNVYRWRTDVSDRALYFEQGPRTNHSRQQNGQS